MQKSVNIVDLVKSFRMSIYYSLAKIGFDTTGNGPLSRLSKFATNYPEVRKTVRTNTGSSLRRSSWNEGEAKGKAGTRSSGLEKRRPPVLLVEGTLLGLLGRFLCFFLF